MTFIQHSTYISLPKVTSHANGPKDLRDYLTKVHQIFSSRNLLNDGVNATIPMGSVHPLSNERGDIKKESNISKI